MMQSSFANVMDGYQSAISLRNQTGRSSRASGTTHKHDNFPTPIDDTISLELANVMDGYQSAISLPAEACYTEVLCGVEMVPLRPPQSR
jgi:hypothetical protein